MLLPIPEDVLRAQARERLLDALIGSLGVSAAAVSAGFAMYMVVNAPGAAPTATPRLIAALGPGVDHGASRATDLRPPQPAGLADAGLDFTPTGSIAGGDAPRPEPAPARAAVLRDFAVRDAFDDTALVEAHGTLQLVRPGDVVPGAGQVLSIARAGAGWVVTTAGGAIVQRR